VASNVDSAVNLITSFSSFPASQDPSSNPGSAVVFNVDSAANLNVEFCNWGGFAAEAGVHSSPTRDVSPDRLLSSTPSMVELINSDTKAQASGDQVAAQRNPFQGNAFLDAQTWEMFSAPRTPSQQRRCKSLYGTPRHIEAYSKMEAEAARARIAELRQSRPDLTSELRKLARQEDACHARVKRICTAENHDTSLDTKPAKQVMIDIQQARRAQSRAQLDTHKQRKHREHLDDFQTKLVRADELQMARTERKIDSSAMPPPPRARVHARSKSSNFPASSSGGQKKNSWDCLGTPPSSEPRDAAERFGSTPRRRKKKGAKSSSSKASVKKTTEASSPKAPAEEITEASTLKVYIDLEE
jgi:hypothetical protein